MLAAAQAAYQHLPHDLRRTVYAVRRPGEFRELQRRRRGSSADFASYTVFEQTGTLFIHVPKAAGLSLWTAIYGRQHTAHVSLDTYRMVYPRRVFDRLVSFAFVRDPWDRVRSAYDFLLARLDDPQHRDFVQAAVVRHGSLDAFVRNGLADVSHHPLFRPQMHYVGLPGSSRPRVDFLGRYETLGQDYLRLVDLLGIEARPLPHEHRTATGESELRMSRQAVDVVGEFYQRDVRALGYTAPRG